ncbi:MAG: filamentous hemagglutinin N-terminal domain-containing protein, partial [Candidatus Omnitrophica bacterium]|nr:filamentous hemagglutinin N-terminal domain-containing protein [Candidatus Omnitrophota bacterium]
MKPKLNTTKTLALIMSALFIMAVCSIDKVYSLPEVDEVQNGSAEFVYADANTMIITASDKAIVNFKSFDIMENERVTINLPNSSSEMLNRVTGPNASYIMGSLSSNGRIFLVNPNGVNIGPNAQITAVSVVISTRNLTNTNFLSSQYIFEKLASTQIDKLIKNQGVIEVSEGGFGVLIAGAVENDGRIIAPVGTVAIATGDMVRLDVSSNGMISIAIEQAVASQIMDENGNPVTDQIRNTKNGRLEANGGHVVLKAESISDIFTKAINLDGVVRADKVEMKDGVVRILSSKEVEVKADISASKIEIGSPDEAVPTRIDLIGAKIVANGQGISIIAKGDINTTATITAIDSNVYLTADYDLDNVGE